MICESNWGVFRFAFSDMDFYPVFEVLCLLYFARLHKLSDTLGEPLGP